MQYTQGETVGAPLGYERTCPSGQFPSKQGNRAPGCPDAAGDETDREESCSCPVLGRLASWSFIGSNGVVWKENCKLNCRGKHLFGVIVTNVIMMVIVFTTSGVSSDATMRGRSQKVN